MKKQFLLMVFVFLASTSIGLAQELTGAVTCPVPRVVDPTCLPSDALHPIPGTPYTYEISVPSPAGLTGEYTWFVTQDKNFIVNGALTTTRENAAGGNFIAAAGTGYNDPATGTNTLSITWKSFIHDAANPVFVVIQVRGKGATDCTNNNLKVYKIEPVNAFTLDIANLSSNGTVSNYGANLESCVANIASATYDATSPEGVVYDYGQDYIFFVVTAANFSTSWRPTFRLAGLAGTQTSEIHWAYQSTPTVWNAMTGAGNGDYTTTGQVDAKSASGAVGAAGECIIVRVLVDHNKEEVIADQNVTLAVDGKTNLAAAPASQLPDIHHASGADCGKEDEFRNDVSTHVLKQRPEVIDQTDPDPTDNFLPKK